MINECMDKVDLCSEIKMAPTPQSEKFYRAEEEEESCDEDDEDIDDCMGMDVEMEEEADFSTNRKKESGKRRGKKGGKEKEREMKKPSSSQNPASIDDLVLKQASDGSWTDTASSLAALGLS